MRLRKLLDAETRLAREDTLTHLPNRREFFELGRQALAQARREGTPITAAVIDLDKFKEVNDKHGHAAGDGLRACVADGARARLRASDIAGRIGGAEFALLLPGMDGTSAKVHLVVVWGQGPCNGSPSICGGLKAYACSISAVGGNGQRFSDDSTRRNRWPRHFNAVRSRWSMSSIASPRHSQMGWQSSFFPALPDSNAADPHTVSDPDLPC